MSFDARHVSGSSNQFRVRWYHKQAADAAIGGITDQPYVTLTTEFQRFTTTFTLTAAGTHGIILYLSAWAADQIVEFDGVVVEVDPGADLGYFDGSSLPTAAWLDPYTGQLGTAHNSPSVEWAQAWVEEGTTNEIPDPVYGNGTITNHWGTVGTGTTLARTTAYAVPYGGVAAAQVTCDGSVAGQGLTLLSSVAPAAASGQTKTAQVAARGSGTVKIQIVGLDSANAVTETFESSAITLDDTWKTFPNIPTLTATFANASTAKYVVRLVTTTAQAVTFYVGYVGAEPKSYATTPCHGSMGTGYSWSGTAHASSSTRTASSLTFSQTDRIDPQRGAIVFYARRLASTSANQTILDVGDGTAGKDRLTVRFTSTGALEMAWQSNGAAATTVTTANTAGIDSEVRGYVRWDGTAVAVRLGSGSLVTGTRDAPAGNLSSANPLNLGRLADGSQPLDGLTGPVLILSRILTDAELARIDTIGEDEINYDTIRAA